jgi:hypothetical protein
LAEPAAAQPVTIKEGVRALLGLTLFPPGSGYAM